eukprot:EG_transcript_5683
MRLLPLARGGGWRGVACTRVHIRWYTPILERIPDDLLRVAVIGRPNVGKSTLFNRLTRRSRGAIVGAAPGVTRDVLEAPAKLLDLEFTLLDTPGVEATQEELVRRAGQAARTADVCLFVVDVKAGVTEDDLFLSKWIRSKGIPAAVVLNKCDNLQGDLSPADLRRLRLGAAWRVAAESSLGFDGLHRLLEPLDRERRKHRQALAGKAEKHTRGKEPGPGVATPLQQMVDSAMLRLAIVGRPNAGKSTLFNRLLGEDRSTVGDQPGTTRDSVEIRCMYGNTKILLADTAGLLRPKHRRPDPKGQKMSLEEAAHRSAVASVKFANVVVLLIDARKPMTRFDIKIASQVIQEGRCLVLAANKWDEVVESDQHTTIEALQQRLFNALAQVAGIKCVAIAGRSGFNVSLLMDTVVESYRKWNAFLPPAVVQRFIERLAVTGTPSRFMQHVESLAQVATRPPTFLLRLTKAVEVKAAQERWLVNALRTEFGLEGVPLRLTVQSPRNVITANRRSPLTPAKVDEGMDNAGEAEGRRVHSAYGKAIPKRATVVGVSAPHTDKARPPFRRRNSKYRRALRGLKKAKAAAATAPRRPNSPSA